MITMGTVMEIEKKKTLVFTLDGSVVYIKPRLGLFVGQQVSFSKKEIMSGKKRLLAILPFAAVAAALLIAVLMSTSLLGLPSGLISLGTKQCAAFIALDINPSVQFKIDENGTVISAAAMNADGTTLLDSVQLVGKPIAKAIELAIASARSLGFIKDDKSVVLVAGTLNDDNARILSNRSQYSKKLQTILNGLNNGNDADVLALYVDDAAVKQNADSNGLSLGRELLKEFAAQNHIALADNEVRTGRIADLIDKLGGPQKCIPTATPDATATPEETAEPTDEPTDSPTEEPTDEPTVSPTEEATPTPTDSPDPTAAPTDAPTPKPTAQPVVTGVSCRVYGSGLKVSWPKAPNGNGKFLYYKVVFSVKDSSPTYPENGYARAISDINTLSVVIKAGSAYNGGDVGGRIKPGETYYVSVTYVYENEKLRGNAVRIKCPAEPEPTPTPTAGFDGTVSAYAVNGHIHIKWDKAPEESGFDYYKVVLSKTSAHPKYPDDGYLDCISDIGTTSCNANPGDCYNGDLGQLNAGETYYISVTYVYDDRKLYGTAVRVKMPGSPSETCTPEPSCTPEPTCTPDPTCTPEPTCSPEPTCTPEPAVVFKNPTANGTLDGTTLKVSWKKLPAATVQYGGKTYTDFQYYKVVVADHPNPKYPEDGYKDYLCDIDRSYDEVCLDGDEYASGTTWYVAITYVFSNGKIYSSDDSFTIP